MGFFVVEGGPDSRVPAEWLHYARRTMESDAIKSSLPHRGPEEQHEIASCFAGVTSWQQLCEELNLNWAEMPP